MKKRAALVLFCMFLFRSAYSLGDYIPPEVVQALKNSDVDGAIRAIRLDANTPRLKYLLNELVRVEKGEGAFKRLTPREFFNLCVGYHNIYLFLKGMGEEGLPFFKKADSCYQKVSKKRGADERVIIGILRSALYHAAGNHQKAEEIFAKLDISGLEDSFRKYEALAHYFAAKGDVDGVVSNLRLAYAIRPDAILSWVVVSDDFTNVSSDPKFSALIEEWKKESSARKAGEEGEKNIKKSRDKDKKGSKGKKKLQSQKAAKGKASTSLKKTFPKRR